MNNVESFVKTHGDAPTAEVLRQDLLFHHPGRGGIRRGFNDQGSPLEILQSWIDSSAVSLFTNEAATDIQLMKIKAVCHIIILKLKIGIHGSAPLRVCI